MDKKLWDKKLKKINKLLQAQNFDFSLEYLEVHKNNRTLNGIMIVGNNKDGIKTAPVIYVENEFLDAPEQELADGFIEISKQYKDHPLMPDIYKAMEKDYILSHVEPLLYNISNADKMKADDIVCLNTPIPEFYAAMQIPIPGMENGYAKITQRLLNYSGLTIKEVFLAAMGNLDKQLVCKGIEDEKTGKTIVCFITNKREYEGAAALFSPAAIRTVQQALGESFYILPISINEIACISLYAEPENMQIIADIYSSLDDEYKLSDSLYLYHQGTFRNCHKIS